MPSAVYPMIRGRTRLRGPRLPIRSRARLAAALVLASGALLIAVLMLRPAPRVDPTREYADARAAFAIGNYSAARNHAQAAANAAPGFAAAHLMLARAYLALGDGLAAEAALTRARDAGAPAAALHAYRAQSQLLQGDVDGALDDLSKAPADIPLVIRLRARAAAVQGHNDDAVALLEALVRRAPSDGEAWADLGRVRFAAGDIGGAVEAAAQALRMRPRDPIALTLEGEIVRTRYGLIAALPWFEAALKRDAYYHPALIEYAATLGEAGRNADMLAATRKALAARPGSAQALYLQAVLAARAGRGDLARSLLGRTGDLTATLPGALLMQGGLAFGGGRDEQAIGSWRRLADRQPMNVAARRLLAAALLRSGDAQGALDLLRPMALRGDADTYTLTLVGRAFEAVDDRAAAATYLDRAASGRRASSTAFATDAGVGSLLADAAQAPRDPTYALGVIRAEIGAGDAASAVARARGLVAAAPGAPAAQLALGDALAVEGRYGEAVDAYAGAADLAFDEPTLLRLVDAFGRLGRARDAASSLALYLAQNPQSLTARRLLGHWQLAGGRSDLAVETLEGVRRAIGNRDAALLADLALGYAATGEGAIARRYARAAYALAPMNARVADVYGVALDADGDQAGARQLLTKAVALDPDDATIAAHLRQIGR